MNKAVSLTQAAVTLGVHRNTLKGWLEIGCPHVAQADRRRGVEWQIDTAAVFAWRVDTAVKEAVAGYQTEDGSVSKDEADRRRAVALAIVAEIEADTALGSVLLRADAEAMMADFCQVLRSQIGTASNKIASRCHLMKNPAEARDFCVQEFNKAYSSAEQQLKEAWERDDPGVFELPTSHEDEAEDTAARQ